MKTEMKSLQRIVAAVAAIAVIVFLSSLVFVIATDGRNELAAEICSYSLVGSFVMLVLYQPRQKAGNTA